MMKRREFLKASLFTSGALALNQFPYQLFAGPRLALDHDGCMGGCDPGNLLAELAHGQALAEQRRRLRLPAKIARDAALSHRSAHRQEELGTSHAVVDTDAGLAAYVYTADQARLVRCSEALEAGVAYQRGDGLAAGAADPSWFVVDRNAIAVPREHGFAAVETGLARGHAGLLRRLRCAQFEPALAVGELGRDRELATTLVMRAEAAAGEPIQELPIDQIQRGRYQPRRDFDEDRLRELADSIAAQGVIQPIVVRPVSGKGSEQRYEIIAGERRWRAAQLAGLDSVPAVVREIPDESAIAMALIENIQRENLNPLEEARALDRLIREFDLTHGEAAEAVGRSRASVSNLLRLQELADKVKPLLEDRQLEMGHARALLGISDATQQYDAARQVVKKGLSVRETERLVKRMVGGGGSDAPVLAGIEALPLASSAIIAKVAGLELMIRVPYFLDTPFQQVLDALLFDNLFNINRFILIGGGRAF